MLAPASRGRTRVHKPPELFKGFLNCYYKGIYGTRPVTRKLGNTLTWLSCGFEKPSSQDTVDRFLTDVELVVDDVFNQLVERAACRGLLYSAYRIDSTHVTAIEYNNEATWNYDSTAEEHCYGFGCVIFSDWQYIPIAVEFTQRKQINTERAMRVTKDALTVDTPTWMLGDSAYDILEWHDFLLARGIVPIAPYNPRNTDNLLDIEYRVEDCIDEHAEDGGLKQSVLAETYDHRTQVERTNEACKDCGLGHIRARGCVHARR